VEIHFIKAGMLAAQTLVDQRNLPVRELFTTIEEIYFSRQEELFTGGKEDIDEMRIIASWCLTRRDESQVLEADRCESVEEVLAMLVESIEEKGRGAAVSNDGAVSA
jgi:hypothetical protein